MADKKKGKFSSRLLDMKFMKRAEEKKTFATATKRKREDEDEVKRARLVLPLLWRVPGEGRGGCRPLTLLCILSLAAPRHTG